MYVITKITGIHKRRFSLQIQKVDKRGLFMYKQMHNFGQWIFETKEEAIEYREVIINEYGIDYQINKI